MLSAQRPGERQPHRCLFRPPCLAVTSHGAVSGGKPRQSKTIILWGRTAETSFTAYDISQAFQLGSLVTDGNFGSSLKSMIFL
jgi:hypothetical protein